jgi:hypothetical protein
MLALCSLFIPASSLMREKQNKAAVAGSLGEQQVGKWLG